MTEPEPLESHELVEWEPPAVVVRSVYDEDGKLNSLAVEWQTVPMAEDIARVLAQFLMPKNALPSRMPRDPVLGRQFENLTRTISSCFAVANIISPHNDHENHICVHSVGHDGDHLCGCGCLFGG